MYQFIDTNETSAGVLLPAEALQINGEYIETLIDGYRTLSVEGREALTPELATYENGIMDGSRLQSKRYPARTIIIKYQLISKSAEEFRAAYNKLAAILNVENAELIFNDEQDKYFTGTPSAIGSVEPGKNAVIGEFEILCVDPFKYSVTEYTATPVIEDNSILIDYNGTYKSYPVLQADFYSENESDAALTGDGDCGYVAFFNENEKIIQIGDPDETDTVSYEKSQTLALQSFDNETAWGATAQANWSTNVGKLLTSNLQQSGNVKIAASSYLNIEAPTTSGTLLTKESTQAKPNIKYTVTAKAYDREEDRINVKVTVSAYVKGVTTTKTTSGIKAGMAFNVTSEGILIYKASDSTSPSGRLSTANWSAKKLYLWDASIKNNRIRVTSTKANVGVSGQVTGWVNFADTGFTASTKTTITTGLGKGYGLKAAIQLGGSWKYVALKEENATWNANATYTKTFDVTVKSLAADTTVIEDIKFKVERTDDIDDKIGIIEESECADLEIATYTAPIANEWYLTPETYGTFTGWHGPSITRTLPADAAGNIGAANFSFSFKHKIGIGTSSYATQEAGALKVMLVSGSGDNRKVIAGVDISKGSGGTSGSLCFYVNGKKVGTVSIDLSNSKAVVKNSVITKTNGTVSFDIGGIKKTYNDSAIAASAVTQVTFHFAQYATKPALSHNGIYWAKFVKNNCDTWQDIPNKFSSNDVVIADCKNGEIQLNGVLTPSLGALGNDWEEFYLTPGLNQLGFAYSDWVKVAPVFKVRYREVFL